VFYRREGSGSSAVTAALLALWLILAVYLITHPDPISIIVLVLGTVIAGFALFVTIFVRRAQREQHDDFATPTTGTAGMSATTDMSNGRHRNPTATDHVGDSDADGA
jgi:hypothetical protein